MPPRTPSTPPDPVNQHKGDELLNVNEIAAALRISKMTVYRFVQDGRLPAIRVGKSLRVQRDDLEAFLRGRRGCHDERSTSRVLPEPSSSPDTATHESASRNHNRATVVVGIDGSTCSHETLRFAVREARRRGALLRAVMAWDPTRAHGGVRSPTTDPTALEQNRRAALNTVVDTIGNEANDIEIERVLCAGKPAQVLLEEAHRADLLVVGSPRHRDPARQLSDSVSYQCAQHATCPVTVVHAKTRTRGRQPSLSTTQQAELRRMHATGEYSITELAELFSVSRPTVYRNLRPATPPPTPSDTPT